MSRLVTMLTMTVLALTVLSLTLACGSEGSVSGPGPLPDPIPSPPAPPPGPSWPTISFPLRASGHQFVDASNRVTWRWAAEDLYGPGWVLPSSAGVSISSTIRTLAAAGINWVEARPGPQGAHGPDGRYAYGPALWGALDDYLAATSAAGQAAGILLFDWWVVQHGYSAFPEWSFRDAQGSQLTASQLVWLRELAEHLRPWQHVVLVDGNETFKASPSVAWFKSLRSFVRRELPGRLLCTNAESRAVEREADCVAIHQDSAVGVQSGKPTFVNESGPGLTLVERLAELQYARRLQTAFDLWRGDMSDEEWAEALRSHAEIRRASGH